MSIQESEIRETLPPPPPPPPPPPTVVYKEESLPASNSDPSYTTHGYYEDRTDKKWRSCLVPMLVVFHVVVFVILMYVNNCRPDHPFFNTPRGSSSSRRCVGEFLGRMSFLPLKENPLLGPSSLALINMGAVERFRVVYSRQVWRLVSSILLHAGLAHLLLNMLSLVFIGIRLEQQFGFVKVGIIYVLSGIGGGVLSSFFLHNNVLAGASGPLFGLLGAMLAELITNCDIYSNKIAAVSTLIAVGTANAALGILPRVGNFGNIGGFFTGFLLGFVLLLRPQHGWVERPYRTANARLKAKYKAFQYVLWLVSLVVLIVGFTAGFVLLFAVKINGNKHCSWCRYLICVPTSRWYCQG